MIVHKLSSLSTFCFKVRCQKSCFCFQLFPRYSEVQEPELVTGSQRARGKKIHDTTPLNSRIVTCVELFVSHCFLCLQSRFGMSQLLSLI